MSHSAGVDGCVAHTPELPNVQRPIAQNLTPGLSPPLEHRAHVVLHAPLGGVLGLVPGGLGVQEREAPDREGRRGEERGGAKHDSPARERSISGSGDDAA